MTIGLFQDKSLPLAQVVSSEITVAAAAVATAAAEEEISRSQTKQARP